jgi:glycosyltransferase involved in cell wall biosynthesis
MTSPLISVIVPVHNAESTIEQTLKSVLDQTFTEFEIIVIDDDSDDSSAEIVLKLARDSEKIKLFRKNNEGPGIARNVGLDKASGQWIFCLDADDYIEPTFFEQVKSTIAEDIDVVVTNFATFNQLCKCKFPAGWSHRYTDIFKDDGISRFAWEDAPDLFFEMVQNIPWNKVVRKSLLDDNDIRFLDTYVSEDMSYSIKACTLARSLVRLSAPNVVHREYTGQSAMDLKNEHPIDFLDALADLKEWLTDNDLFIDLRVAFDRWALNAVLYNLTTHDDNEALSLQVKAICNDYFDLFGQYHTDLRNEVFAGLTPDHKELADCLYGWDLSEEELEYRAKELRLLHRDKDRLRRQKMLSGLFRSKKVYNMADSIIRKRRSKSSN